MTYWVIAAPLALLASRHQIRSIQSTDSAKKARATTVPTYWSRTLKLVGARRRMRARSIAYTAKVTALHEREPVQRVYIFACLRERRTTRREKREERREKREERREKREERRKKKEERREKREERREKREERTTYPAEERRHMHSAPQIAHASWFPGIAPKAPA